MICYWFCWIDGKFVCMIIENCFNGFCFVFVIVVCVCFVSVDVINFFRFDVCVFDCFLYCFCIVFFVLGRCGNVVSIISWVVVDNFFVDFCIVGKCMFKFFKYDDFCVFFYDKVVMVFIKWVVCCFWIRICRKGFVCVEVCKWYFC